MDPYVYLGGDLTPYTTNLNLGDLTSENWAKNEKGQKAAILCA
jgi:hypothetical protein